MNFSSDVAMRSASSFSYKSAISPVFSMQLTSSRNYSWMIYVSARRKTLGLLLQPESNSLTFMSSLKFAGL